MNQVFDIHLLPAQRGDSLWIEYSQGGASKYILIDGGITATAAHLRKHVERVGVPLHIELLVVTHIDLDHIQGIVEFMDALPDGVTFGDIWFNGRQQLEATGLQPMGVKDGIRLSEILQERHSATWNRATAGKAVALEVDGKVVIHHLEGGMKVTVLGPGHSQLARLRDTWDSVLDTFAQDEKAMEVDKPPADLALEELGLIPMGPIDVPSLAQSPFKEDNKIPNGSSIALLLEFAGRRALMLGDAYPSVITQSLRQLSGEGGFKADVVKVSHHGSRNNTDMDLASLVSARTWIYSSNGANNTQHPHREAVARVLHADDARQEKRLVFNYRTGFNEVWDDKDLMKRFRYQTHYGDGELSLVLNLVKKPGKKPVQGNKHT